MLNKPPIDVVHLLPVMDKMLIGLLKSLSPEDWERQSVAGLWKVKDIAAHLLDGNIRSLSMLRDGYFGEAPGNGSLLDFLNRLNADWVKAMKRVSPQVLIWLHEATGKSYCDYYASLDPFGKAGFSVAWAGEEESKNWMHIAREYTEKWLHQQQIRDTVNKPGLMAKEFYYPFMNTFMQALPYTYREIHADAGTLIKIVISGDAGGNWYLGKTRQGWALQENETTAPAAIVSIAAAIAWKLFSKSIRASDAKDEIIITGEERLALPALDMVSVMA
ncbi:maleylpyruvate isomerase N-terminal domain-containing protein [Ferruginibacter sp. HRS2-29]|uniref:maleylpyruvate isomerase N-terminal domain-containing protein n=1 Tax=Ferruginibacter sp. HRS2-29 TaxID=2487334 RepID=UPI0020CB79C7|nr:maleylpyruvate isomerase N-terminal domain-containing protein [Ferruginibacter sp. HRS2-29]MCP9749380.1 hypothetical protein [Ferruginibacter sp. HRS2-29]